MEDMFVSNGRKDQKGGFFQSCCVSLRSIISLSPLVTGVHSV